MEKTPSVMKIHKVYSNTPIVFDDDEYGLLVLVTFDDEPIEEAQETTLHFSYEQEAEEVIKVLSRQFDPVEIRVMLREEMED